MGEVRSRLGGGNDEGDLRWRRVEGNAMQRFCAATWKRHFGFEILRANVREVTQPSLSQSDASNGMLTTHVVT